MLAYFHVDDFQGTLRSNLDPFEQHDDARLWDALKRSYLVDDMKAVSLELSTEEAGGSGAQTPVKRLTLDSPIEDEGSNLSVGQVSRHQNLILSLSSF